MNPITLYFAGAWIGKATQDEIDCGIKNKLCSYVYPDQLESWLEVSKNVIDGKILIDSGAFSAWNKGDVIDLPKYIKYCQGQIERAEKLGRPLRAVNLDVIPGKKGETSSLVSSVKQEDIQTIESAAQRGYENMKEFLKEGIKPIHVFHQGENFKWLDKMVQETDYIGVSPANDVGQNQKRMWIDKVFSYIVKNKITIKTHGFAVWSPTVILNYPWTSCDAATWRLVAAYGGVYYPVGGFTNPDFSKNPMIVAVSEQRKEHIPFTEDVREDLSQAGFSMKELETSWGERCRVNVKYFLELEKWTNAKKAIMQYQPTKGFF